LTFSPSIRPGSFTSHTMGSDAASPGEQLPPFLAGIDLATFSSRAHVENAKELAYAGGVIATVTTENIDQAFALLSDTVARHAVYLEVSALESQQDIIDLLDAGAAKVFVTSRQATSLQAVPNIDHSRIVYCPTTAAGDESNALDGTSFGLYLQNVSSTETVSSLLQQLGKNRPPVYVSRASITEEEAIALRQQDAVPIIAAAALTVAASPAAGQIRVVSLVLAQAKSDRPDGLFTTLVTDERGVALGLVYSNEESVAESLRSGRGVYHSRKRGLWRKGDTSGDWQELVRVETDCDQDCLSFIVRQQGNGFCHLQTATCFGQYRGLSKLQKTLQSRKQSAPVGSYTARLFSDSKMLNAKIMEEAAELCEASSKSTSLQRLRMFYTLR